MYRQLTCSYHWSREHEAFGCISSFGGVLVLTFWFLYYILEGGRNYTAWFFYHQPTKYYGNHLNSSVRQPRPAHHPRRQQSLCGGREPLHLDAWWWRKTCSGRPPRASRWSAAELQERSQQRILAIHQVNFIIIISLETYHQVNFISP